VIEKFKHHTFLRAKVVDSKDPDKFGKVKVWVPDIMPLIDENDGMWARPANNPIGGRNSGSFDEQSYAGTCYIPQKGSWVWIFFELGCPNYPYYLTGLDIENGKVLPECQLGTNYDKKWVVLKSHQGRCIVVSDDPDDERVEITGKKRKIKEPPTGDTDSVYTIDENQTTILFDERKGKEKILIRTYKGDFFHIDIDSGKLQISFSSDIEIKSGGKVNITGEEINLSSNGNINLEAIENINIKGNIVNTQGSTGVNLKSDTSVNTQGTTTVSIKAGTTFAADAPLILENGGASQPAGSAGSATAANPEGSRDT